jgi:squalene-hopene/tetraprenyl-beta-curcumene cyclase
MGLDRNYPAVRRAIAFLRDVQELDGSWFGRWGCNYLYGTWLALWGLDQIGEDTRAEWGRRAARWIEGCQNPDGGWGELPRSYDDPAWKGRGPSTPSQTAWAVLGLLAAGEAGSDAVRRGIEYLVAGQRADGGWGEEHWTGTGFPRVFYLRYHMYRLYFPLLALGEYRKRVAGGDLSEARAPERATWVRTDVAAS